MKWNHVVRVHWVCDQRLAMIAVPLTRYTHAPGTVHLLKIDLHGLAKWWAYDHLGSPSGWVDIPCYERHKQRVCVVLLLTLMQLFAPTALATPARGAPESTWLAAGGQLVNELCIMTVFSCRTVVS